MIKLRLAQGYTIFDSGAIPTSILSQGLCYFPLNQVIWITSHIFLSLYLFFKSEIMDTITPEALELILYITERLNYKLLSWK